MPGEIGLLLGYKDTHFVLLAYIYSFVWWCFVRSTLPLYSFRYGRYAKGAETQAIRAGLFTSAVMGGLFFLGLGMFGIAFWYVSIIQSLSLSKHRYIYAHSIDIMTVIALHT